MYVAPKAELVRFEAYAGGGQGNPVGGGSDED